MALDTHERVERQRALDGGDGGAVLRRDIGHEAHEPAPARAWHVLHDNRRVAWQMAAEMACQEPRIRVIGPTRRGTDVEADLLALKGILRAGPA